ncbi:MAG: putative baseplate assembly protein [Williamsia sp.]|nr:putative baseplate assembly protein [Williamsia sp.]
MNYFCCTDTRRNAVKLHPTLNGIDFLEVIDQESDPYNERQTTLFVHFLKPLLPGILDPDNLVIEGGERIRNIAVVDVSLESENPFPASPPEEDNHVLVVKVSQAGDFSPYTLRLVQSSGSGLAPDGFDPVLSAVGFSFKVSCPSDFDCQPTHQCPPEPITVPDISYLAKDYASFRRLMLDRMALLAPEWKERNPADMGIALVELLAYVGDYLSYKQDAIATEAYLGTARKRISVRRHARLVDYFMHDGCNARAWLHIQAGPGANGQVLQKGTGINTTRILTRLDGLPPAFRLDSREYEKAIEDGGVVVFEPMHDLPLYTTHNELHFYTWGGKACCLPKGATRATLAGSFPNLKPGDVLVLSEVLGPETGLPEDADPARQHAVRLIEVTLSTDLLYAGLPGSPPDGSPPYGSPPDGATRPVTEIKWHREDALPFPLCISNQNGIENISVAYGNILLADHGLTVVDQATSSLDPSLVPATGPVYAKKDNTATSCCVHPAPVAIPVRFRPRLLATPLTFAAPLNKDPDQSATDWMQWSLQTAMPEIELREEGEEGDLKGNPDWHPKQDLLNSASNKREFVVEVESDGTAYLRFGDDIHGARPVSGTQFDSTYRIGNGRSGNIGARALAHLVTNDASIMAIMSEDAAVWNPLPARGGTEAESMEEAKQYAPEAFRTQERAVTAADYEEMSLRCDTSIQRTAATFRWTGSWKTVFLSVDRLGGEEVDAHFESSLRSCLEKYRMAGFDLEADAPIYVSLEIELVVCVNPRFFASDVKKALLEVFSNQTLPDGSRGLFHPDNFSFGQPVYLSPLYAAAQAVQGVDSVRITVFQRQGQNSSEALTSGKLLLGRREIARLDNDRNFPERGVFSLAMKGGRS